MEEHYSLKRAVIVALALPIACGQPTSIRVLQSTDLKPGAYLLAYASDNGTDHDVRNVRIWFEVGRNRTLLAVRSEEVDLHGQLIQATLYRRGEPQTIRDYQTCTDARPAELPTEPFADQLITDTVGPPLPYAAYGFEKIGNAVEANDGEVRTVLTERHEGDLADRRIVRYNSQGAIVERVDRIQLRRAKAAAIRAPLTPCSP